MNHARLYDIMSGDDRRLSAGATRLGLSVLEPGYRLAIALRNTQFDRGWRTSARLPRSVISVGNLTTGGTGKTPMVIELARRLLEQGSQPAVLMRGYMAEPGGAPSDEAREIADELGSAVPVEPNPSRVEGAQRALEQHPETDVFLLDDGFQHRQVHRDLDLVLIDATRPFGFDRLLPRGLLREPAKHLARADAVIVTRSDLVTPESLNDIDRRIESLVGQPPTAHTASRWTGFRGIDGALPEDGLTDKRVVGVCAIGNPNAFKHMLRSAAGEVLGVHTFDDHHDYRAEDVRGVLREAEERGAGVVVVTEKDWVKWEPLLAGTEIKTGLPPVIRPVLNIGFRDGSEQIDRLLKNVACPSQ